MMLYNKELDRSVPRFYSRGSGIKILTNTGKNFEYDDDVDYNLNSDGSRSDEFTKKNNKSKILFLGCSNTYGVGQDLEDVWCNKLYKDLSKDLDVDGFYNLGMVGASINDIVFNFFRYVKYYGVPDIVFALLPERDRDDEYFYSDHDIIYSDYFGLSIYQIFDTFCSINNIKLFSSTWIMDYVNMLGDFKYLNLESQKPKRELLNGPPVRNDFNSFKEYEKLFTSFKTFDNKKFISDMYEFSIKNKKHPNLYVAKDNAPHFGAAFHEAWKNQFYERFKNEKNNI